MVSSKMLALGTRKSTIREIFEYGRKRAEEVGEENVFDFSLGNPNIDAPDFIKDTILEILGSMSSQKIHGYTVAPGDPLVRETLAQSINKRFGANYGKESLFLTAGAAAALTITLKALAEPQDEFIVLAPFFPEYRPFVESVGGKLVVVPALPPKWEINLEALESLITERTKAVIVNSPNNPSGAVYSETVIKDLSLMLERKEKEYGHPLFIIADEPYRELVYEGTVPFIPHFYAHTIICYSYSKSFSLPGERIGYILMPQNTEAFPEVMGAVAGAARVLTHVNAPSLWQLVIARCANMPVNIEPYRENGDLLYKGLVDAGFTVNKPQGAFYLFPKSPFEDEKAFCQMGMKYDLLMVPGTDFGCPGYFRVAYCVKKGTIEKAIPRFKQLMEDVSHNR